MGESANHQRPRKFRPGQEVKLDRWPRHTFRIEAGPNDQLVYRLSCTHMPGSQKLPENQWIAKHDGFILAEESDLHLPPPRPVVRENPRKVLDSLQE